MTLPLKEEMQPWAIAEWTGEPGKVSQSSCPHPFREEISSHPTQGEGEGDLWLKFQNLQLFFTEI